MTIPKARGPLQISRGGCGNDSDPTMKPSPFSARHALRTPVAKAALALLLAAGLAAPGIARERGPRAPQATLSAEANQDVLQDTVQITLAADLNAATQEESSQQLNTRLDQAMQQLRDQEGIEVHSGSYRIWPVTTQDGTISQWRGQAELIIESRDFARASKLAASVSGIMPIGGLYFSLSRAGRAQAEQALLDQAVAAFRERAQNLTQALGYQDYRLRSVDLGASGAIQRPMPVARMMSVAADSAPEAPLQAGYQNVSVSVQGSIELLATTTNQ